MLTQEQVPFDALLGPYGLLAFLLFFVILGGLRKWWVWGWQFEDIQKDRDEWRNRALKSLGVTEKATDVLGQAIPSHMPTADEVAEAIMRRREEIR